MTSQTQDVGLVGPGVATDGTSIPIRQDRTGSQVVVESHGRYYESVRRGNCHFVVANITAPPAYTTVTAQGGPVIYNPPGNGYNIVINGVSWAETVAETTAAIALGLTGGPCAGLTGVTAADSSGNCTIGGPATTATLARVATINNPLGTSAAAGFFFPLGQLPTSALTAIPDSGNLVDLGGLFVVPPGYYIAVSVSAASTASVDWVGVIYEEVPVAL